MPNQQLIQMYMKLFNANDEADAQEKINAQVQRMVNLQDDVLAALDENLASMDDPESAEDVYYKGRAQSSFEEGYYAMSREKFYEALSKNLAQGANGGDPTRDPMQVARDFAEYTTLFNEELRANEVGEQPVLTAEDLAAKKSDDELELRLPSTTDIIAKAVPNEDIDEQKKTRTVYGWMADWTKDSLKSETPLMDVQRAKVFGWESLNERTNVTQSSARATQLVSDICQGVTDTNRQAKCAEAMAALRVMEEKHRSRGFWWRLVNVFGDSRRENRAIAQMKATIERSFTAEERQAVNEQSYGANLPWIAEAKENTLSYLKDIDEMKIDVHETKEETERRVAAEKVAETQEKEELEDIAIHHAFVSGEMKGFGVDDAEWKQGGEKSDFETELEAEGESLSGEDAAEWDSALDDTEAEQIYINEADDEPSAEKSEAVPEEKQIDAPHAEP